MGLPIGSLGPHGGVVMTGLSFDLPDEFRRTLTELRDVNGELMLAVSFESGMIHHPNGTVERLQRGATFQLTCGLLFNMGMLGRENGLELYVCEFCRRPPFSWRRLRQERPTHGICSRGQSCLHCGSFGCPRHVLTVQGEPRCVHCLARDSWARLW